MAITIGHETSVTTAGERRFFCRRCRHRRDATVRGIGIGMQSILNSAGTALRRARADGEKDLDRTIKLARCPNCRERNPGALLWFWAPFVLMFLAFLAGGIVAGYYPTWSDMNMDEGDRAISRRLLPLLCGGIAALVIPFAAHRRWGNLDRRIRWADSGSNEMDCTGPGR